MDDGATRFGSIGVLETELLELEVFVSVSLLVRCCVCRSWLFCFLGLLILIIVDGVVRWGELSAGHRSISIKYTTVYKTD